MILLNLQGDFSFNERAFSIGLHLSQTVGTFLNLFTLSVIYAYKGQEMKSYRWHLFLYQLFSTLLDFGMDTMAQPLFFFPHMAGTAQGWLRTVFGMSTFFVYVSMMTFGGYCLHFICFSPLYFRWQTIIPEDSIFKLKTKTSRILFQVGHLIIGTPMLVAFMCLQYEDEQEAIAAFVWKNPNDAHLATIDGFYVLNTWKNDMVIPSNICTLFWLLGLIFECIVMSIGCASALNGSKCHMSQKTRKMHIRFLKNIFFQSSVPMLLLEIPVVLWFFMMILSIRFSGIQDLTNLTVFCTCIHGAFGSLTVFYLNSAYRYFVVHKFQKLTRKLLRRSSPAEGSASAVIVTSMSSSNLSKQIRSNSR